MCCISASPTDFRKGISALGTTSVLVFLGTALLIAVTPGPGIFYVAARTLAGGRNEGLASSFGTGVGGLVHVFGGAVGVSAIIMASAEAFTLLKIGGALYLFWLGYKTIREARVALPANVAPTGSAKAFREGILVEALNPKTAVFFLAFIPQFVDTASGVTSASVALQFIALGLVSVFLNTLVDVIVAIVAARARSGLFARPDLIRRIRMGSGLVICGIGGTLLFARRAA